MYKMHIYTEGGCIPVHMLWPCACMYVVMMRRGDYLHS